MNTIQIEIIGLLAAGFTTFAFVPQAFKIWKNRNAIGVSVLMYVIMLIGIFIWIYYGFLIKSLAVITANIISALLQLFIIVFALINRNNE